MPNVKHPLIFLVSLLFFAYSTHATTPSVCTYKDTFHIAGCSNANLTSLDTLTGGCLIGKHLLRYTRYIDEKEGPCSTAVDLLEKRYRTFADPQTFRIDYSNVQWLGDTAAPVTVLMYISMSCPHCKQVYQQLYDTLHMNPSLKKIMRLGIKYRSESKYDNILSASTKFNKQPAFLRRCADISGRIDDAAIKKITQMIAINPDSLKAIAESEMNILLVRASKSEAIENGVEFTPAVFINDRKYHSTKNAPWILDAVEFFAADKKVRNAGEKKAHYR